MTDRQVRRSVANRGKMSYTICSISIRNIYWMAQPVTVDRRSTSPFLGRQVVATKVLLRVPVVLVMFVVTALAVSTQSQAQSTAPDQPAHNAEVMLDPQIVIWTDALGNSRPTVAFNPMHDEFLVAWDTDQDAFSRDIWARRVAPDGTLRDSFNVANAAGEILEGPAIAYCPPHDQYLVGYTNWYEATDDTADVQARQVAWDGGWMSNVFTVTPGSAEHIHPSIAYNIQADEYLVTYSNQWPADPLDLYAQRIRASDGALLSWNAVASDAVWSRLFSKVAYHPGAYGGAGGYLIVYQTWSSTLGTTVLYKMTRSDLSDLFSNPEFEVSNSSGFKVEPGLDVGESGFLISWWENTPAGSQVRARRIGVDGTPLGNPAGFAVSGLYVNFPTYPRIAVAYTHVQSFLVLWNDENALPGLNDIHGVLVSEEWDGTIGDEIELREGAEDIYNPSATCSPTSDCLIVYEWWNNPSYDVAGRILHLPQVFSDGFESGDFSAWSDTVP